MSLPQLGYSSYPNSGSDLASPQLLPSPPATTSSGGTCCENGRALVTDPRTGQSICSCQYSPPPPNPRDLLAYGRVPGLGEPMYPPSPYPPSQGYMGLGTDPSAFYSPLNAHYELKEVGETWRGMQSAPCYAYDPNMAPYSYSNAYSPVDINNAARRKNATRENTNTLKAWLYEHRKNPYPSKGEKIMLAIITKMTLTQVSTWFANARRRLKKENKMTWSPRNRSGDADDDENKDKNNSDEENDEDEKEKDGEKDDDEDKKPNIGENGASPGGSGSTGGLRFPEEGGRYSGGGDSTCHSGTSPSGGPSPTFPGAALASSPPEQKRPDSLCSNSNDSGLSDVNCNFSEVGAGLEGPGGEGSRPKIWSLARTATSDSPDFLPNRGGYAPSNSMQGGLGGGMQGLSGLRPWENRAPSNGGLYPSSMSMPYHLGGQKMPSDSQNLFGPGGSPGMNGGMAPAGSGLGPGLSSTSGLGPGMGNGVGMGMGMGSALGTSSSLGSASVMASGSGLGSGFGSASSSSLGSGLGSGTGLGLGSGSGMTMQTELSGGLGSMQGVLGGGLPCSMGAYVPMPPSLQNGYSKMS